jgi:hypothetical protein
VKFVQPEGGCAERQPVIPRAGNIEVPVLMDYYYDRPRPRCRSGRLLAGGSGVADAEATRADDPEATWTMAPTLAPAVQTEAPSDKQSARRRRARERPLEVVLAPGRRTSA